MSLIHENEVGIVLPDARVHKWREILHHEDKSVARPHVGYLRFDLANLGVAVPAGPRPSDDLPIDDPQYEVVHLFNFEELDFGLEDDQPLDIPQLIVAEVEKFATGLVPRPGLFGSAPPEQLLMRTVLRGGTYESPGDRVNWMFERTLDPNRTTPYVDRFAGNALWTREVNADQLTLRLRGFTSGQETSITLRPGPDGFIRLKIANLCTENPMEWEELGIRDVPRTHVDDDFKWFYKLLQHPTLSFEQLRTQFRLIDGLPHPKRDPNDVSNGGSESGDCGKSQMHFDFRTLV
jgi:hypothetical protein